MIENETQSCEPIPVSVTLWLKMFEFLTDECVWDHNERIGLIQIDKNFIDQKRDEKMYKKVWSDISVYYTINREEIRLMLMVLYTEISDQIFLYIFSSRFWSIKSFKTLSECESRIVGRSPNFAITLLPRRFECTTSSSVGR